MNTIPRIIECQKTSPTVPVEDTTGAMERKRTQLNEEALAEVEKVPTSEACTIKSEEYDTYFLLSLVYKHFLSSLTAHFKAISWFKHGYFTNDINVCLKLLYVNITQCFVDLRFMQLSQMLEETFITCYYYKKMFT